MDLIKIIRKLKQIIRYKYHYSSSYHAFKMSESMHTYHRATSYEHLALNQRDPLDLDQRLNEKIQKYQRNAIWYFLHSALKGYSTAQYKLGMIYLQGQLGLSPDKKNAYKWLLLAANQGHLEAQYQLYRLYVQ